MSSVRVAAVLAAGGAGTRFSAEGKGPSKQFVILRGRPIYVWSLLSLAASKQMTDIVIVCPVAQVESVAAELKTYAIELGFSQAQVHVTAGGGSRQESVYLGLQFLAGLAQTPDYVLVHDAARPFLDPPTVDRVIETVIKYGACTVGVQPADTIKRINNSLVVETLDRGQILLTQTPQAAPFSLLLAEHKKVSRLGVATTDDASLMERAGLQVHVVPGNPHNIKVTEQNDLLVCEALAKTLLPDRL
ncbi:MAG: 2-C-methyl-D-erythritol 4-phosphate cytidylyltransferase [Candidatus Obscuribacterales bacterium]|nr:2-C-methyl-D-erythritol 4-phosphate cytidylyltransferase [Candidatus Obscuribacterales bacterium]